MDETWEKMFLQPHFAKPLQKCLLQAMKDQKTPRPDKTLRAFNYFPVHKTRVIILGQDPYPNPKNASGLSFSSDGNTIPASLRQIYHTLLSQGLIDQIPKSPNLESWAQNGVLLLNRYLTRGQGKGNKGLHVFWEEFTNKLLQVLSQLPWDHKVFLCLWGKPAQNVQKCLAQNENFVVLTWGHPSPLNQVNRDKNNPKSFWKCDHFKTIAKTYPGIWN